MLRPSFQSARTCTFPSLSTCELSAISFPGGIEFRDRRACIQAKDGGTLALDFASAPWLEDDAPIVLILPGVAGSTEDMYVKSAAMELIRQESGRSYRAVIMNTRGSKSCPLTSAYLTHAGSTDDVRT